MTCILIIHKYCIFSKYDKKIQTYLILCVDIQEVCIYSCVIPISKEVKRVGVEMKGRPNLINARKSKGISQVHIARQLGYTTSNQYSSMEKNRNVTIKVGQALAIARMLGTTVEELFFDEEVQVS